MSTGIFNPVLSLFPQVTDPGRMLDCPLSEVMSIIQGNELAEVTRRIRGVFSSAGGGIPGKRAIDAEKKGLPAVTLAGIFSRRANAGWRDPSCLVQVDLDNLIPPNLAGARAALRSSPWVACGWISPSGAGIKAAVRVPLFAAAEPSQYTLAWHAVSRWLVSLGLENDRAAKDAARLAFLAHDPDAWYNTEAIPFDLDEWTKPQLAMVSPAASSSPSVTSEPPLEGMKPDEVERRARAYVREMPTSDQGNNGSASMVAVVRILRDGFDLTGAVFWRLLEQWNRERASPAWSISELQHALASVETIPPKRGRGWLLIEPRDSAGGSMQPWPPPTPIGLQSEPPPFNMLEMVPADVPDLGRMVDAVSESIQVPLALVACAAVGLAALAGSRAVEVQCSPDWREPAPLWMLPLLRPGERKSASLGMLMRPFIEWSAKERKQLAEPLARYAEQRRTMEARLTAVRTKSARTSEPDKREKLVSEASDLAAELESMPARLAAPDLLVQSFTPEGLRDALEANGEKMGIVSAEADAAELLGARYTDAGPSLDLLLCAHAGDPITTRRAGGRCVPLVRPAVGMVLAVQPEAVRSVLADRAARGRGLIDRMLLIHPPSRLGARMLDPPPVPSAVSDWWASIIGAQLDLPWPGRAIVGHDGAPVLCSSQTRILSLSVEARNILWALRANLEPRLAEGADLAAVSGFASKLPGACARIALAFTMLRDPNAEVVGEEAMRAACTWAPFLLAHHQAVLGEAVEKPEAHHAQRLWNALKRRGRALMSARDLFRLVHDSALPDMEAFAPVLALMLEHDAMRQAAKDNSRSRHPAELYEIHPDLLPNADSSGMANKAQEGKGAA